MARKMLINATRPEEVRVAIIQEKTLESFEVAAVESGLTKGNIYRGIVVNVRPALEAAFVDIGTGKDALLRADDVVPQAMHRKPAGDGKRPRIENILERGRAITVQVTRDPIAHKGAQVTTNVSLAGRYLVVMPFDDVRGVSRRTEDDEVRKAAKEKIASMNLPEDVGVIVRTNALDQPKATLNRDLNAIHRLWKKIKKEASTGKGTKLLYSDQDLVVQALRDHLDSSITEVLVDDDQVFAKAKGYMASFMPRAKTRLVRYTDRMPLFSHFQLEEQIDCIYQRTVSLPSGGSIVIDGTEALTAIDVNSGRGTRGANQEENALNTNLEAARAVARQLRLRDIGGLLVVDFIDMRASKNNKDVEKTLRDSMKVDKARFTVSKISPNGLLEINRQRIKKALSLRSHRPCPTCEGSGTIASSELVGLNLLRRIETRAASKRLAGARIELHPELADAFQNERRQEIAALEREFELHIEVIAASGLHRSEERVSWIQREEKKGSLDVAPIEAAVTAADLADSAGGKSVDADLLDESIADVQEDQASSEEAPKSSRRRRRRGGRSRKKTTLKKTEGEGIEGKAEESPEVKDVESPVVAGPSDEDSPSADEKAAAKPSRRRRRPRRSKKPKTEETKSEKGETVKKENSLVNEVGPASEDDPFAY
ncbi:MAG: Rne/Rng family ribonuclease [Thermoanaerobaculales bacterium]|nr:Rne/Rng family ribonuclease [Thermoanaerobaculales bacterium]